MDGYQPQTLSSLLSTSPYPGRGIVIGQTGDGANMAVAYFIMGRSANSRNRVFVKTEDGIRTQAHDPARLEDPSLILYHPVRRVGEALVVTNGDQTDTVRAALLAGGSFEDALASRSFEPDAPHFTPRISGLVHPGGKGYQLAVLKSADREGTACTRQFFSYPALPGVGHLLHTYDGDGNPLPSFTGEPKRVEIPDKIGDFARLIWESLDRDNKISLFVRYEDLHGGGGDERIINRHGEEEG